MSPLLISLMVFGGVTALVIAVASIWRGDREAAEMSDRLTALTSGKAKKEKKLNQ